MPNGPRIVAPRHNELLQTLGPCYGFELTSIPRLQLSVLLVNSSNHDKPWIIPFFATRSYMLHTCYIRSVKDTIVRLLSNLILYNEKNSILCSYLRFHKSIIPRKIYFSSRSVEQIKKRKRTRQEFLSSFRLIF